MATSEVSHLAIDTTSPAIPYSIHHLLGANIALWYHPQQLQSPKLQSLFRLWKPAILRLPGGSWSDQWFWNGYGLQNPPQHQTTLFAPATWTTSSDHYSPGFRIEAAKDQNPSFALAAFHGNADVKTLHEFAQTQNAKAIVTVNAGTGTPEMAAAWLAWAKRHGYDVPYWEIGNELDGAWELGHIRPNGKPMTADEYATIFLAFAQALKKIDPTIKVGGPACSNAELPWVETLIRKAGNSLDFISFHTYPVQNPSSPISTQIAAADSVISATHQIREWIRQYHPNRLPLIEIAVTEWHKQVMETSSTTDLSSGLWAATFIGNMAQSKVTFANAWDCFSSTPTGGHGLFDPKSFTPRAFFGAFQIWQNHMLPQLIPCSGISTSLPLKSFASTNGSQHSLLLINFSDTATYPFTIDLNHKKISHPLTAHRYSCHEYLWNPYQTSPEWSLPPSQITITPTPDGTYCIPPESMLAIDLVSHPSPPPSSNLPPPSVDWILPKSAPANLPVVGYLTLKLPKSSLPYPGETSAISLSIEGPASIQYSPTHTSAAIRFSLTPTGPGPCKVTAHLNQSSTTRTIDFLNPIESTTIPFTFSTPDSTSTLESSFALSVSSQARPNQSCAVISFPALSSPPKKNSLIAFKSFPNSLSKTSISGAVATIALSPDFTCADPSASIEIVLESSSLYWMPLKKIPLHSLNHQFTTIRAPLPKPEFFPAMPNLTGLRLILHANAPVLGSIYIDDVGFLTQSSQP